MSEMCVVDQVASTVKEMQKTLSTLQEKANKFAADFKSMVSNLQKACETWAAQDFRGDVKREQTKMWGSHPLGTKAGDIL